ncbi:MAG: helix-turn-helix domain-containing protein [Parcubacteria group bacterium]|nr:helix-turn-helix domain-containing protein [Parcubacteria group bacterium]
MDIRSLNEAKLAVLTGIQERYIGAILEGQSEKLPPLPYVRGYLNKIAQVLDSDGNEFWELYKNGHLLKSSGSEDQLPRNRFAVKTISRSKLLLGTAAIALLLYGGFQFNKLLGVPEIKITNPMTASLVIVNQPSFSVSGIVSPKDKLFINGENIVPESDGTFNKEVYLEPGLNTIEIKATRFLGRETSVRKQIIYQP